MKVDWMGERRRSARVELLTTLQGHFVALGDDVVVRQVSLEGLQLETSAPLSLRGEHDLRLICDDRSVVVRAHVLHSRVSINGDDVSYVSGVELVEPSTEATSLLGALIEHLAPPAVA